MTSAHLRQRLIVEAPGAVLDDHTRKRRQTWEDERARVERLASASVAELARDGEDVDAFAVLLLSFAMQMNVEAPPQGGAQRDQ